MADKRPVIDTEPDDVFESVFGPSADQPFGPAADTLFGAPGAEPDITGPEHLDLDLDERNILDLDTLELSDEVDADLWAESDPEHDGVDDDAAGIFAAPADADEDDPGEDALYAAEMADAVAEDMPGEMPGDEGIDLEAVDLPDEVDPALWAAMEAEEAAATAGDAAAEAGQAPSGVFDAAEAEALRGKWMAMLDNGVVGFRLDMADKAAVDADGLAFLAAFARELKATGGALTVAASGQVLEVLTLCGLDRRWPVVLEGRP